MSFFLYPRLVLSNVSKDLKGENTEDNWKDSDMQQCLGLIWFWMRSIFLFYRCLRLVLVHVSCINIFLIMFILYVLYIIYNGELESYTLY